MSNLVLTRRKHESIILHQDGEMLCNITITALGPKQVKLAFQAEDAIKIDRQEVYELKNATNNY